MRVCNGHIMQRQASGGHSSKRPPHGCKWRPKNSRRRCKADGVVKKNHVPAERGERSAHARGRSRKTRFFVASMGLGGGRRAQWPCEPEHHRSQLLSRLSRKWGLLQKEKKSNGRNRRIPTHLRSSASHHHCSSLDEARPLKVGDAHPPLAPLPPLPPSQPPPSCSPLSPSSHPPRLRHLLHILPSPHHRLAAVHRCLHRRLQSLALHLHRHILSAKTVPLPPPPPPSPAPFTTTRKTARLGVFWWCWCAVLRSL